MSSLKFKNQKEKNWTAIAKKATSANSAARKDFSQPC